MATTTLAATGRSPGYATSPPPARRAATLAAVVAIHLAVAALLLGQRHRLPAPPDRTALDVFDVVLPPAVLAPVPIVPSPEPAAALSRAAPNPGGSTGRIARTPAPGAAGAASAAEMVDTTPAPLAPPAAPPRIGIGTATDLAGPGAAGVAGTSAGLGTGRGNGIGDGTGSGGGAARGGTPGFVTADWIEKPGPAEWRRAYPADALRYEVRGRVELACVVPRPGPPQQCRVVRETPGNQGFGRAALALSRLPSFKVRPARENERDRADIELLVPVVFTPVRSFPIR